jgi:ferric-dicitrate binding protein FerR (iron transport regulator)
MDIKPGSMGKPLPGIEAGSSTRQGRRWCENSKPGEIGDWRCGRLAVDDAGLPA